MEFIEVVEEEYYKKEDNLEAYEKAFELIKDELYGEKIEGKEYDDPIEIIKDIIKDLEDELR